MNSVFGLSPDGILRWVTLAASTLARDADVLNSANVFPVADSDTGTNMALTMAASRDCVEQAMAPNRPTPLLVAPDSAEQVDDHASTISAITALSAAGRGALLGARGNSGVILAEFFTGLAQACAAAGFADLPQGQQLAVALTRGQDGAHNAVGDPVEGTILTAARTAAAQARTVAAQNDSPAPSALTIAQAAANGAARALDKSSQQLAVLARSAVLDAGAYGLVLVLGALEEALGGRPVASLTRTDLKVPKFQRIGTRELGPAGANSTGDEGDAGEGSDNSGSSDSGCEQRDGAGHPLEHVWHRFDVQDHTDVDGEFEVMMLVHSRNGAKGGGTVLRSGLQELGESVVVVGGSLSASASAGRAMSDPAGNGAGAGDALWQCHVHTDVPEQVLKLVRPTARTSGIIAGAEVYQIVIRSLFQQVRQLGSGQGQRIGMVACTDSPGVAMDLARSGAVVVVRGTTDITATDVERAALEFSQPPIIITNSETVSRDAKELFEQVISGKDDIHVVAAVAAISQELSNPEFVQGFEAADIQGLVQRAEQVISKVQYVLVDPESSGDLVVALDELFNQDGEPGTLPVVTALVDQEFPTRYLTDLIAGIEHRNPDAEIITLASGKLGTAATVCLEWM